MDEGAMDAADAPSGELPEEAEDGDADEARRRQAARRRPGQRAARPRLQGLHAASSTRSSTAEDLCEPEELDRLRAYLDKQLHEPVERRRRGSPTGCSAG